MTGISTTATLPATDVQDLLVRRYGEEAPVLTDPALVGSETLALLLRHRSVRRFAEEPVSDETVTALVAAAQSAATSSNHQAWSVVAVRDAARIRRLTDEARASEFVREAPLVLLFVADWSRAADIAAGQGAGADAADYLESTLVGFVDAALAAQNAVIAAESLGLGTCYLGSLRNRPEITAEIAGLPPRAVVAFGVAIGHPSPDDEAGVKPRLPQDAVRSDETYRSTAPEAIESYERTLAAYQSSQGRPAGWAAALVARVRDIAGLHGRETARASLERRGLPSR